jgi:hypothetical protein
MKVSMPQINMQPVRDAAVATKNATVAGAKETGRVIKQTATAGSALVQTVALSIFFGVIAPVLYFASKAQYTALKARVAESYNNLIAQTKAIVVKPQPAPAAAAPSRKERAAALAKAAREAVTAVLSRAAEGVKANKGAVAATAIVAASAAGLYYFGLPTQVTDAASKLYNKLPEARVPAFAANGYEAAKEAVSAGVNATRTRLGL